MYGAKSLAVAAACLLSLLFAQQGSAQEESAETAIKVFLQSQSSAGNQEEANSEGSAVVDLNGDGKEELVLVWSLLGASYWRYTLTVFTRTDRGYRPESSLALTGMAKLAEVKKGTIYLDQTVYAKNDPICCPSLEKRLAYRWKGKNIVALEKPTGTKAGAKARTAR